MAPSIILDDSVLRINFNLLGNSWQLQTDQSGVYNGTVTVWKPGASTSFGTQPPELELFYYGTDFNIYGTVSNGVTANYTIDETSLRPVPFPTGLPNGKTGINLFSLSNLTESFSHDLSLFPQSGELIIDFVTYTPNTDTPLTGLDLILDDADSPLQYSQGQWNHTTGDFASGRPYKGTMTGTNTKGATMKLTFEGSDISVYGLLNQVEGRLAVSFSVDGQTPTKFNPFNGSQSVSASSWKVSQEFFHQDLSPGQHTLSVNLTDVSANQMLWIDSVVYEATSQTTLAGASSAAPGSSDGGSLGLNPTGSSSVSTFPRAAIGGIAAGAFLLAIVLFGYARRQCNGAPPRPPKTQFNQAPLPPISAPANPPPWTPWQTQAPPMTPPMPAWTPGWDHRLVNTLPLPLTMPVPTAQMDGSTPPSALPTAQMDGSTPPSALPTAAMLDGVNPDERPTRNRGQRAAVARGLDGANPDERPVAVNRSVQEDGRD